MGLVHVTARISALAKRRFFEAEFLVDTGALNCMAPAAALRRIGLRPEGKEVFELASGETVEYPYAFARVAFFGAQTVTRVIFGPDGSEPLLGVIALEDAGIGVDPVSRAPKRMAAKPLKVLRYARPDGRARSTISSAMSKQSSATFVDVEALSIERHLGSGSEKTSAAR